MASVIPEIGPSLGRLTDPPAGASQGALKVALDDLRLELVTRLFELAGAGRQFAAAGDRDGALQSLGRVAWLGAWEQAVAAAAARLAAAANAGLRNAAAESRLPERRLRDLLLTSDDTQVIVARLGSGAADFVAALDALEAAGTAARTGHVLPADSAWLAWQEALGAVARRIESAWLALETASLTEQHRWHADIARVRAWRRPAWPLWLIAALVLGLASYFGLVLGGYVAVPTPLRGLAELWWSRRWI